jgi:putative ABC transport system permease protein
MLLTSLRFALGASVRDITRIVLTSGVKLALIGSALGLLGAAGLSRLLAVAYPGMQLNNLLISIGATFLLIAVALVASWLPARRAARINPIEALRAE